MISYLKESKDKYLVLLLIIFQQFLLIAYICEYFVNNHFLGIDKVALIFVFFMNIYLYLAGFIRDKEDKLLRKIILIMSVLIWQYLFILNENDFISDIGLLLQPLVVYFFTVESFNFILYGKYEFKKRTDKVVLFFLVITVLSFFINKRMFNLFYLFLFLSFHIYPMVIMVMYRKYFKTVLSTMRRDCMIFSAYLSLGLILNYIGSLLISDTRFLSNIGWYFITITFFGITYLKAVQDSLILRMKRQLGKVEFVHLFVMIIFIFLWMLALASYVIEFEKLILVISTTEIFIFLIVLYIYVTIKCREKVQGDTIEDNRIMSMLKNEEKLKERFAMYLHDDILQSVIAAKNLMQYSEIESDNQKIIVDELYCLINNIRDEIDTYHPVFSIEGNLKEVFLELIEVQKKKYNLDRIIIFCCQDYIPIFSPYDCMVYRIIKELINNAMKYSSEKNIELSVKVENENVVIRSRNVSNNQGEIKPGVGLGSVKENIRVLGGNVDWQLIQGVFSIEVVIPMDGRICYENFID